MDDTVLEGIGDSGQCEHDEYEPYRHVRTDEDEQSSRDDDQNSAVSKGFPEVRKLLGDPYTGSARNENGKNRTRESERYR